MVLIDNFTEVIMRKKVFSVIVLACLTGFSVAGLPSVLAQSEPAAARPAEQAAQPAGTAASVVADETSENEEAGPENVVQAAIHPIDQQVNELLDKNQDTHGQIQAIGKGIELWDAELNRVYKELMTAYTGNEKAKAALKTAQLAWLKFRDAEHKHLSELYSIKDGSMYRIFHNSDHMELIKARALELKSRLDTLNDAK